MIGFALLLMAAVGLLCRGMYLWGRGHVPTNHTVVAPQQYALRVGETLALTVNGKTITFLVKDWTFQQEYDRHGDLHGVYTVMLQDADSLTRTFVLDPPGLPMSPVVHAVSLSEGEPHTMCGRSTDRVLVTGWGRAQPEVCPGVNCTACEEAMGVRSPAMCPVCGTHPLTSTTLLGDAIEAITCPMVPRNKIFLIPEPDTQGAPE